jgi:hypothetical protein
METLSNDVFLEIVRWYPAVTRFQDPDDVLEEYNLRKIHLRVYVWSRKRGATSLSLYSIGRL